MSYFTNPNLHAFEEFELAARLRSAGWRLMRLNAIAVKHYGHAEQNYRLLKRRWDSRYAWAGGELLRETWGTPSFWLALKSIPLYRVNLAVFAWWLILAAYIGYGLIESRMDPAVLAALVVLPILAFILRKHSAVDGLFFFAAANVYALGTLCGLLAKQRLDPAEGFGFTVVQ
jgi:hypothetical protein